MSFVVSRSACLPLWVALVACAPKTSAPVEPEAPPPAPIGGTLAPAEATAPSDPVAPSPVVATTVSDADRKRIDAVRDREMAVLTKDPRWAAYLKRSLLGVTDPQVAFERGYALGQALTQRGVARLSAAHLDRWCELRLRLAETSEQACAGLWSGDFSDDAHTYALSRLSEDDLADLMRINADAGLAELSASEPLAADAEALRLGLDAIAKTLGPAELDRWVLVLTGGTSNQSDFCFATKVLHGRAAKMPDPLRGRFLRALAVSIAEPI